jgi:hypothetical protein
MAQRPTNDSDPDALQERTLKVLEKVIREVESDPAQLLADKGAMTAFIGISEHLRKLNADRYSTLDLRALSKLSPQEFEDLERQVKETDE